MRAYLAITGTIFGLLAILHIYRMVAEWNGFGSDFWTVIAVTLLLLALSFWAWRLFAGLSSPD